MAIENYYHDIAKVTQDAATEDGRGGKTYTWSESIFQGAINQASSREIEQANRLSIEADYKLYCSVNEDINNNDLVKDGTEYYRVVSKPKNTLKRNHHHKILLKYTSLDKENFGA